MNTFKQAHALTRLVIQDGDNYQATFTLCLRAVIADAKQVLATQYNTVFEAINYHAPTYNNVPFAKPLAQWNTANQIVKTVKAIHSLGLESLIFLAMIALLIVMLLDFNTVRANTDAKRTHDRTMQTIEYVATMDVSDYE